MSWTNTHSMRASRPWGVTEVDLRNRSDGGGTRKSANVTACSVPLTLHFTCQEDLLALLQADPPSETSAETETDAVAPGAGHRLGAETLDPEMVLSQSIAELKQQLSHISIESDDELFKSAPLNVGKYVVGPVPGASECSEPEGFGSLTEGLEIVPLDDSSTEVTEGSAVGGWELEASDGAAIPTLHTVAEADIGNNPDKSVHEGADDHLAESTLENFAHTSADGVDNGKVPRVPPNTPATKERIWWENELLVIKKSKLGGLGAFAAKDLKYGDKLLEETPILRTNNWGICNEYDSLSAEDKELFHSLHKFSSNPNAHEIEKIRRANSFQLPKGVAIYSVASRFNHACLPARNVNYVIDSRGDAKITLTAIKAIPKGTELTICYGGKPEQLLRGFGFRCECGGCEPLTDKQADDIMKVWKGDANRTNNW